MLSIKLNLVFYDITKLQLDWTLDGDGTPLYMTGILQASPPTFTKLALPGAIVLHEQLGLNRYTDRSLLELSVYRWVYLVKATLIWFMAVKVETILPMEITATCATKWIVWAYMSLSKITSSWFVLFWLLVFIHLKCLINLGLLCENVYLCYFLILIKMTLKWFCWYVEHVTVIESSTTFHSKTI